MAILSTGNTFSTTDTVTHTNLNNIADAATFDDPVDDSTLELHTDGKLRIKDDGVTLQKLATALKDALYPVGSIYTNATDATNPATLIGFGTWVAFGAGKVPVGIDAGDTDFDTVEETGGAKTHTLAVDEIPIHDHDTNSTGQYFKSDGSTGGGSNAWTTQTNGGSKLTGSAGGDQAHNNLQPYIVVYMWKRTV